MYICVRVNSHMYSCVRVNSHTSMNFVTCHGVGIIDLAFTSIFIVNLDWNPD